MQPTVPAEVVVKKPASGKRRLLRAGTRMVGVFNIRSSIRVWENVCPHQGGPVCHGVLTGTMDVVESDHGKSVAWVREGEVLACPWHGLEFDVLTGEAFAWRGVRLRKVDFVDRGDSIAIPIGGSPRFLVDEVQIDQVAQ